MLRGPWPSVSRHKIQKGKISVTPSVFSVSVCDRIAGSSDERDPGLDLSFSSTRLRLAPLVARPLFSIVPADREPGTGYLPVQPDIFHMQFI